MTITQIYNFTEKDKRLLRTIIPEDPCDHCDDPTACPGCPKERVYNDRIREYKNNNIFEIALDIRKRYELTKQINQLKHEIELVEERIPEEIRNEMFYLEIQDAREGKPV